jgi:hypothetical protein
MGTTQVTMKKVPLKIGELIEKYIENDWKLKIENWKLKIENWKLKIENWKLKIENWKLKIVKKSALDLYYPEGSFLNGCLRLWEKLAPRHKIKAGATVA